MCAETLQCRTAGGCAFVVRLRRGTFEPGQLRARGPLRSDRRCEDAGIQLDIPLLEVSVTMRGGDGMTAAVTEIMSMMRG